MEGINNNLSLISYNCEHANNLRLPFLQDLFERCDFLLIQEHGLYQSKLSWFNAVGNKEGMPSTKVGIHGVSAMDEGKPLRGRPNGGTAILWYESIAVRVTPVAWDSIFFVL